MSTADALSWAAMVFASGVAFCALGPVIMPAVRVLRDLVVATIEDDRR